LDNWDRLIGLQAKRPLAKTEKDSGHLAMAHA